MFHFIFIVFIAWLSISGLSVYVHTRTLGHLMIGVGATLLMSSFLLLESWLLYPVAMAGKIIAISGFVVLFTFDRDLEHSRIRESTWLEILIGRVPSSLSKHDVGERNQGLLSLLLSFGFAVIFYVSGRHELSFLFLSVSLVYGIYIIKKRRVE